MVEHIKFAHVDYSIKTKSLDLFVLGCFGRCADCCNPELKNFNQEGYSCTSVIGKILQLTTKFNRLIDRIMLVGGDFVDNYTVYKEEMTEFLKQLKTVTDKPLYLFTRHELDEIPADLVRLVDYVKTGAYIPELRCDNNVVDGIKLATSNQKIYKVDEILNRV